MNQHEWLVRKLTGRWCALHVTYKRTLYCAYDTWAEAMHHANNRSFE